MNEDWLIDWIERRNTLAVELVRNHLMNLEIERMMK